MREFGGETMDYQAVRKKYTLYTRGAGIVAMVLILCVAVVISDTLLQTVGVLVIKDILESYLIRSVVLSQPELSREELDVLLNELTITDPTLAKKTEQVSVALYDLTIAHESNDYFETLTNEFKYPQLEIIYYQALNATIKGDADRANELLRKLVHEDKELYVVRMAKGLLNGTIER